MTSSRSSHVRRRGMAVRDVVIGVVVILVVGGLLFPVLTRFRERARRMECEANLRHIGSAIERYRSISTRSTYPCGSDYSESTQSAGTSWWLSILPHADAGGIDKKWNRDVPDAGDFTKPRANGNVSVADGYQATIFFCPSSALPLFADPARYMSETNRKALGREAKGIAVPMYVAVSGSAPDAMNYDTLADRSRPSGRNSSESTFGILSASGVFPPNLELEFAAVRDLKSKTILVGEQSDYVRDTSLDPPDVYDVRSAWPKGAFMGTAGEYREVRPTPQGLGGLGSERCWNITSVRYPLNSRNWKQSGYVVDPPPPRPANPGDPPPPLPPYPANGYGPGHNHGLISAHPGGVQVLMADGSAPFLNEDLDLGLLIKMCTRDDGAEVQLP